MKRTLLTILAASFIACSVSNVASARNHHNQNYGPSPSDSLYNAIWKRNISTKWDSVLNPFPKLWQEYYGPETPDYVNKTLNQVLLTTDSAKMQVPDTTNTPSKTGSTIAPLTDSTNVQAEPWNREPTKDIFKLSARDCLSAGRFNFTIEGNYTGESKHNHGLWPNFSLGFLPFNLTEVRFGIGYNDNQVSSETDMVNLTLEAARYITLHERLFLKPSIFLRNGIYSQQSKKPFRESLVYVETKSGLEMGIDWSPFGNHATTFGASYSIENGGEKSIGARVTFR
jgi:hypothetical protein